MLVPDFCSSEINAAGPLSLGGEFKTGTQKSRKMLKAEWANGPKKVLKSLEMSFEDLSEY